jgi:hypothetical protein
MPSLHLALLSKTVAPASLAALLLCGGCDRSEAPAPPAKNAPTQTTARDPRAAPTVVAKVQWPSEASIDRAARGALTAEGREALPRAPVPVLLPRDPQLLARGVLIVEPNWYSFSSDSVDDRGAKYHVVVAATRVAHVHPEVPPARGPVRLRGRDAFVTRNEGIPSATWSEHGVDYTVDVECGSPTDARCTADAFLRDLTESLVYVGGSGERGAAAGGAP